MPSALSEILLEDYNVYRSQTQHFWNLTLEGKPWMTKPLSPTVKRLQLLSEMSEWCAAKGLEPRLWLLVLFKSRSWRFPPKCEASHLQSEKLIPKYRSARGLGFFEQRVRNTATRASEGASSPDPNRDLAPAVEGLKRRYAESDQRQRCMDEATIRTHGYHPASAVCQSCPLAGPCAISLQSEVKFDVQGLRSGAISIQQAAAQAKGEGR
jgi:hypothetical protein